MTGPTDPVERWLSNDIDLLPPPAGTFERVHRNARYRKTVRAMSTAAGAAVVIAAAVVLPRVAGGLLPGGNGPGPAVIGVTNTPSGPQPSASGTPTTSPGRSRGHFEHGPALVTAGSGPPVSAGFMPTSVTFVPASGRVIGAALGRPGAACSATCTVLAGTPDYGRTWTRIGAPAAGAPAGSSGVSQVRFHDTANGWAYGPALYATHDGGARWRPVTLPGRVIDLSTVGTMAFAVVATCTGGGPDFAAHCTSFALYQTPVAADHWLRVPGDASASAPAIPGGLQLTGSGGYLLAGGRLYAGPVDGGAWHRVRQVGTGPGSTRSAAPPCLARTGQAAAGTALIAPAAGELYLACGPGPVTVYSSADGGQSWQRTGRVTAKGSATSLSAIPGGAIVLATTRGIYYSTDATAWHQASLAGGRPAGGFAFVGMTNAVQGVAVPGGQAPRALYITADGGRTWQATPVR